MAERLWFDQHVNLPCHPGPTGHQVEHLTRSLAAALREVLGQPIARPLAIPPGPVAVGGETCPTST